MSSAHIGSSSRSRESRAPSFDVRGRVLRAVRLSSPWWPLAAALAGGAVLRFWGIASGVPHAVHVDEPVIVSNAVRMMRTGDLNPYFFDYPTLFIYVQAVAAAARFLVGAAQGLWTSLEQAGVENFYLWGRLVTAVFGVATIALVYASGTYWGRAQAGFAAAIAAVFPMHVRESHFVLADVPVTFFVALALWLSLRAAHAPSARVFAWAGIAVGCAVATKYNAALALLIPLVAAHGSGTVHRLRYAAIAAGSAGATFLLFAPYTMLALPDFLNAFAYLTTYYRDRPGAEPGWSVYLKHLRLALAWPAFLLLFAGLANAVHSALARTAPLRWWLLVIFPLVYFAFVARQGLVFGRYLMPLLPFLALLLATVVFRVADWSRRAGGAGTRDWVAAALIVVVLVPQGVTSVTFDRAFSRPSTTAVAYAWLVRHVPAGATVVVENLALHLPEKRYHTEHVRRVIDWEPGENRDPGPVYLVASSWVFGEYLDSRSPDSAAKAAYERLFGRADELVRVTPSGTIAGPELRIYVTD